MQGSKSGGSPARRGRVPGVLRVAQTQAVEAAAVVPEIDAIAGGEGRGVDRLLGAEAVHQLAAREIECVHGSVVRSDEETVAVDERSRQHRSRGREAPHLLAGFGVQTIYVLVAAACV